MVCVDMHPRWRGVQIFFVLSGFVIAHSWLATPVSVASTGNFALRRQLRLDPTYWFCLALGFLDAIVAYRVHPSLYSKPSFTALALNAVYGQGIAGSQNYLGVSWTLCLEVQFYLVFVVLLFLASGFFKARRYLAATTFILATAIVSLWVRLRVGNDGYPWFIGSWYLFALGTMTCWTLAGKIRPWPFFLFAGGTGTVAVLWVQDGMFVGVLTAGLIFGVGLSDHLVDWLSNPVIQYFGRISYSLYLIHLLVLTRIFRLGIHLTGLSAWPAVTWFFVAGATSILFAHLINRYVEAPTMRLAQQFKRESAGQYRSLTPIDVSC